MSYGHPDEKPKTRMGIKRRDLLLSSTSLLAASALGATGVPGSAQAELNEYQPGTAFPGRMGRTIGESEPAWPMPVRAKSGAPNVLFIVLDDTGFGQLGCYGSPINTPHLDALAADGLRYNNLHTTALCSPTRSCLLTGRNHHSNGMSCITEGSTGYPGGNGNIPFENGMLSEILLQNGYNTYAIGMTSSSYLCLSRGTPTPTDDLAVERGQAWVAVTSPVEGVSYVTAYAPGVKAWDSFVESRRDRPYPVPEVPDDGESGAKQHALEQRYFASGRRRR